MLEFLGYCFLGIFGFFLPRFILGLIACWFFGGWWLVLLIPVTIAGLIVDLLN